MISTIAHELFMEKPATYFTRKIILLIFLYLSFVQLYGSTKWRTEKSMGSMEQLMHARNFKILNAR